MKKLTSIILLSVIAMVVACSHGTHHRQLVLVDSLMSNFLTDSAYHTFKLIDPDEIGNQAEQMYYNILKCELRQQAVPRDSLPFDIPVDSVLNRCIAYYDHANDPRNLVRSYLYKGKLLLTSTTLAWRNAANSSSLRSPSAARKRLCIC